MWILFMNWRAARKHCLSSMSSHPPEKNKKPCAGFPVTGLVFLTTTC